MHNQLTGRSAYHAVGRNPFLAGQNSKNLKLKNIKIMQVRVFCIVWYTFLQEGARPAVRGNAVNAKQSLLLLRRGSARKKRVYRVFLKSIEKKIPRRFRRARGMQQVVGMVGGTVR